jgi:hypothetical protein
MRLPRSIVNFATWARRLERGNTFRTRAAAAIDLVIVDCDGVSVGYEVICCRALAEPMTQASRRSGSQTKRTTLERDAHQLRPFSHVDGANDAVGLPKCDASSGIQGKFDTRNQRHTLDFRRFGPISGRRGA